MSVPSVERIVPISVLLCSLGLLAWTVGGAAFPLVAGACVAAAALWIGVRCARPRAGACTSAACDGDGLERWLQRFASVGLWYHKPTEALVQLTPEYLRIAGLDPATTLEMSLDAYLHRHVHPEDLQLVKTWLQDAVRQDGRASGEINYRVLDKAEDVRYLRAAWIGTNHAGSRTVATQDVTECKLLEERLLRGVLYDALTGLPNRMLFHDRVASLLGKPGPEFVGVALMDLDRFLAVNASLGREAGDALLLGLAVRLVGSLPPGTTVARVGEDEFAALIEIDDPDEGMKVAETMRQALASPLDRGDRSVSLTASVGLVLARRENCRVEALLQRAETALFQARNHGGDSVAVFDERQGVRDREEVALGLELRQAALNDELELHYQPVVRLSDMAPVGFEALVRWRRPGVGLVPPGLFIPVAEQNGAISDIGLWVLHEGLAALRRWCDAGNAITMAINLSPKQMEQDDIVEQVGEALERHRVDPRWVKLEITETALASNASEISAKVARIRAMGVLFSLDDFGTGYSSLGHLHRFPVDTLKIDKSFVDLLLTDAELSPVPRAVVGLAHSMGMDVVAEGIEHPHQLARVKEMGCEMGQGYLFSRPMPEAQACDWLAANRSGWSVHGPARG